MKPQEKFNHVWCAAARVGVHASSTRTLTVATLLVAGLYVGGSGVAHADVPTVGDIAACNQEARAGFRAGTASPISKDEAGANAARKARAGTVELPSATGPGATGRVTQSPDPQIHGMDVEGAQDAAYRAAYRVCMRKNGF